MIRNFENGDIATSGVQFLTGSDATANGVYHRLRMFLGEYFLDVSDGTPWFQNIFGKAPQGVAEVVLKRRIIGAPDVVAITGFEFNSDREQRRLSVSAELIDINNAAVRVAIDEDVI